MTRVIQPPRRWKFFKVAYAAAWLLWLFAVALGGCSVSPRIKTAAATVTAPKEAETPARLDAAAIKIPAGSAVEIRREIPPPPASMPDGTPAAPLPTVETVTITPAADTALDLTRAETGTARAPDVRAAIHAADNAARAPLLWASIGAGLLAVAASFLRYPTAVILCGGAAAVFFGAWQVASLPEWIWALGLAAIVAAVALYFGHERGEKQSATA